MSKNTQTKNLSIDNILEKLDAEDTLLNKAEIVQTVLKSLIQDFDDAAFGVCPNLRDMHKKITNFIDTEGEAV